MSPDHPRATALTLMVVVGALLLLFIGVSAWTAGVDRLDGIVDPIWASGPTAVSGAPLPSLPRLLP